MKVNQKIVDQGDDDKLVIQTTHDPSDTLKQMEQIRQEGIIGMGGDKTIASETRFVGRIPLFLVTEWLKEAGVKWDDSQARDDVIRRKILSGEFDKFRSDWRGNY